MLALHQEIASRKDELSMDPIETIYFGGGTPSILEIDEIKKILELVYMHYQVVDEVEITLESNPDDLSPKKIKGLRTSMINRFSIGVQSFFEEDLQYMNRVHSVSEAERSVKSVQDAGFENITIDLIYGTPTLSKEHWEENLRKTISLEVPHVSCYALTVEENTPLEHLIRRKKLPLVEDAQVADHFLMLVEQLIPVGFEQYEISNFSKPGYRSRHNTAYWSGKAYLGFGPGAHSFNGKDQRRWNLSNNALYVQKTAAKETYWDQEILTEKDRYNEFIMTQIRLQEGISLDLVERKFGQSYKQHLLNGLEGFSKDAYTLLDNKMVLTIQGKLISDRLASDLFF